MTSGSHKQAGIIGKGPSLWKMFLVAAVVTSMVAAALYYAASSYVMNQAERNVQNLLLSHKGIHLYVQRTMLPALYAYKAKGEVPEDFYAPELFSSSFIVRNQHGFYNEERTASGLPELYYKMAAINPRNPVNRADALEEKLIRMFNDNREKTIYREIINQEGEKLLYVAIPFLENQPRCLVCHGDRDAAPRQLQERYPGQGGFNEKEGDIRAIVSIRSPLRREYSTVYIISASMLAGFLFILVMLFFNQRLARLVKKQTRSLEMEIVERKNAEQEVRELNAGLEQRVASRTMQLAAANKELDAFAYSVSHDLRAPLRGIDGFSLALLEDYGEKFDESGKEYLNRVRSGCVKMGNLIDDLLKLSRVTRGNIVRTKIDIGALAEAVIQDLRQLEPHRQVAADIATGIFVDADKTLIQAVLENLLGNSWKFTSRQEDAKIIFGTKEEKGRQVLYVSDNGAGFNMEYAGKLFGAFQRLHSASEFEGTGIGLATVQRIIHRHGGEIWAEGEEGKGAIFYFTIPRGAEKNAQ